MRRPLPLTPLGTAKQRFCQAQNRAITPTPTMPLIPTTLQAVFQGTGPTLKYEFDESLLWQAWELTRSAAPYLDTVIDQQATLFLCTALLINLRQGSTRLPVAALPEKLLEAQASQDDIKHIESLLEQAFNADKTIRETAKLRNIAGLINEEKIKPIVFDPQTQTIYIERMRKNEERLAGFLRSMLGRARESANFSMVIQQQAQNKLREVVENSPDGRILSAEQQRAALHALINPLTVISGGPGTGKTSIVVTILRTLVRLGIDPTDIALAAPTGKAAYRMGESILKSLRSLFPNVSDTPSHGETNTHVANPTYNPIYDIALQQNCPAPMTLHRLLGYSPSKDRFTAHEGNPLKAKVIIVDEGSMIDLFMMDQLVRAIHKDAKLIILGDAEQLPSVEAGAVFRDLVAGAQFAVQLTHSYRMDAGRPEGKHILLVAQAANAGNWTALTSRESSSCLMRRPDVSALRWRGVEHLPKTSATMQKQLLDAWYDGKTANLDKFASLISHIYTVGPDNQFIEQDQIRLRQLFLHIESMRILTLTREMGSYSAEAVNDYLHQRHLSAMHPTLRGDVQFSPGEPVILTRNDYNLGLWNGDQGIILRVATPDDDLDLQGSLTNPSPATSANSPLSAQKSAQKSARQHKRHKFRVVFRQDDGFIAHSASALRDHLSLAYAMTVHKSQGSEFSSVLLVLPEEDLPMLTREIIYTAITRSKDSVVIYGTADILERGVSRRVMRFSGVATHESLQNIHNISA